MVRELERRDALDDVVHIHCTRTSDAFIFGDMLREIARRHDGYALHEQTSSVDGRLTPELLDELCPDWRDREAFLSGPRDMIDALEDHWEAEGDPRRLHMERFQPIIGTGDAEVGSGGTRQLPRHRRRGDLRRRRLDPGRRRGGGRGAPLRLPDGDLPHLRGQAARRGRFATCAPGNCSASRARPSAPASTPPRATSRSSCKEPHDRHAPPPTRHPLHRLTPEQIEEIGEEFQAIHDEVRADLGESDAHYIRSVIEFHRRLAALSRIVLMASRYPPAWVLGTAGLSVAKILENMEIGHNVLHGQWDWMNDPNIHSSTWDWDTASPGRAWKHSHNYVHHTFTNIVGKDKDVGYEIMRVDPKQKWHPRLPAPAVLQRPADGALRVGRRGPRPRLRGDPQGDARARSSCATS